MSFLPPFLQPPPAPVASAVASQAAPGASVSSKVNQIGLMRNAFKLARNKLISRKLEGSVDVSLSLGPLGSGLSCSVTDTSVADEDSADPILRTAFGSLEMILDDLEAKAQEFKDASYADEMTLSGSFTAVLLELSIEVSISATVPALLARKVRSSRVHALLSRYG